MFLKNIKFKKASVFLTAANLFIFPFIASAQLVITGPSSLRGDPLEDILEDIIVGILGFVSILGILFLVYGGIRYITSAGDDSGMEEAKKIIMYSITGLFIVASAYAIVKTVITFAG